MHNVFMAGAAKDRIKKEQGARVRRARLDAGFDSGAEAARALHIPLGTYPSYENGTRGLNVQTAELFGKKFNVNPHWLLTGMGPIRPNEKSAIESAFEELSPDVRHYVWDAIELAKIRMRRDG